MTRSTHDPTILSGASGYRSSDPAEPSAAEPEPARSKTLAAAELPDDVFLQAFQEQLDPLGGVITGYPLVMTNIVIEHGHLQLIFPQKMVIFHSYVELPEGSRGYVKIL